MSQCMPKDLTTCPKTCPNNFLKTCPKTCPTHDSRHALRPTTPRTVRHDTNLIQVWTESALEIVFQDRLKPRPEKYASIAQTLNRLRKESPGVYGTGRLFTERDVNNKWHRLFPSKDDTNDAVKFLRDLEVEWPGTKVQVHANGTDDPGSEPVVESIHILFPWAKDVLGVLAPNIFLDATFNMTVYGYKASTFYCPLPTARPARRHFSPHCRTGCCWDFS